MSLNERGVDYAAQGMRIRAIMSRRNMIPIDVCKATGISKSYLSRVLSGKQRGGDEAIEKIARAIGTTSAYLRGYEDWKSDTPEDLRDFVTSETAEAYLRLAKQAHDGNISEEALRALVTALLAHQKNN